MQIHHIGYIVVEIEKAIEEFTDLGYEKESEIIYDSSRKVDICFVVKDSYRIELVSPKGKESPVFNLQKKYINSPYHICYTCSDIYKKIELLEKKGYVICDKPAAAVAMDGAIVAFLIHPYLGMIELRDSPEENS